MSPAISMTETSWMIFRCSIPSSPSARRRARAVDLESQVAEKIRILHQLLLGLRKNFLPGFLVPHAKLIEHRDERDVALEAGVLAQQRRNENPPLLVDGALARAAEIIILKRDDAPVEARFFPHLVLEAHPLVERIDVETTRLLDDEVRDHDAVVAFAEQDLAKFRRDAQAPLVVQRMFEAAAKHKLTST